MKLQQGSWLIYSRDKPYLEDIDKGQQAGSAAETASTCQLAPVEKLILGPRRRPKSQPSA